MWHCQLIISAFRVVQTCSWISESCSENFQVQDKRCNKRIAQHYYRKPSSWTNKTTERRISNKLHVTSARSWNTRAQVRCKCNAKVTAIIRFTDQTDNIWERGSHNKLQNRSHFERRDGGTTKRHAMRREAIRRTHKHRLNCQWRKNPSDRRAK